MRHGIDRHVHRGAFERGGDERDEDLLQDVTKRSSRRAELTISGLDELEP